MSTDLQTSYLQLSEPAAPRSDEERLLACVHCGLCLEACPTYVHTGDENDSPRGRIYLMRGVYENRLSAASPTFARHINRCLGCRACETACPAGVEYGHLLESARESIAAANPHQTFMQRALGIGLRHVWLHPARLRLALNSLRLLRDAGVIHLLLNLRLTARLSSRLHFALALLDASAETPDDREANTGSSTMGTHPNRHPQQEASTRVSLFTGCVMESLFTRVNRATRRVLIANGCTVRAPARQVCCGALHAHAGDLESARQLARRNIDAFADANNAPIITNAGGCGAMLLSYQELLAEDKEYATRAREFSHRVRDISQQLIVTGIRQGVSLDAEDSQSRDGRAVVTYDASCHLLHGQRADEAPLRMLAAIPALRFAPLTSSDVCCGGAGVYNMMEPELSSRVLDAKLTQIEKTEAEILATGNPGCHMQIGAGARITNLRLRVCHPVELLDESYVRAGFYDEEK